MSESADGNVLHERLAIVATLDGKRTIIRLAQLAVLRLRMTLAAARLYRLRHSAIPVAIYPTTGSPSVVYQLSRAARAYVESHLLRAGVGVPNTVARFLGLIAGCSPSAGGVGFADHNSMVAQVPSIVANMAPTLRSAAPLSVAEVHATRRLYLVFGDTSHRPECVVQFGGHGELSKLDAALAVLHPLLPDLVTETVAFQHWKADTWVHIQRGMSGLPWFRFSTVVTGVEEWLTVRARASQVLSRFQAAVATVPSWIRHMPLGRELDDQVAWYRGTDGSDVKVITRSEKAARALSFLGLVRCQWQHGDYCFNNLLVSSDQIRLIDFEEFGQTLMPLHDEFSLAFSTYDFVQQHPGAPPLNYFLRDCLDLGRRQWNLDRASLEGLLLHHLLWRLRQCDARPMRREMAIVLRRQLSEVVDDLEASRITI